MQLDPNQVERELKASAEAVAEQLKEHAAALAEGRVDDIPAFQRVMARMFADVRAALEAVVETKRPGRGAALKGWLRRVPLDVLAVLSMRITITTAMRDSAESPATMQAITHALGLAIVREALVHEAYKVNPLYIERTEEYLRGAGTTSPTHIAKTMRAAVKNVLGAEYAQGLSNSEYIHLGKHGLDACVAVGLVSPVRKGAGTKTSVIFELAEEVREVLTKQPHGLHQPMQPMLAAPLPWDGVAGGGYYTRKMQINAPLRRLGLRTRQWMRPLIAQNVAQCKPVLDCANYLQGHAFRIHRPTMEAVMRIWQQGGGCLGIPLRDMPPEPPFPFADGWDKAAAPQEELDAMRAWKRRMWQWHTKRTDLRKAHITLHTALKHTRDSDSALWFPAFIDSRGRYYYRGGLNPQGGDIAKALLHFSERKRLGQAGLYWLKVHIANCFGYDKVRFNARAAWVDANLDVLLANLDRPEECQLLSTNTDAPLMAYAALWELRAAIESGSPEDYCTGIPVHMDATCSGLQHFCAMLRDPVGGQYVNLYDSGEDTKADIYRKVAELARARVLRDAADTAHPKRHLAAVWAELDVPRALAKKPVMTYVYGATLRGVSEFVADYLEETGTALPPDVRQYEMGAYLAKVLFDSIEDTVPAAAAAMRWLRKRSQQYGTSAPMLWHSPTGLLVEHDYREHTEQRVRVRSCGLSYIVVRELLDGTRPQSMANAISPNFVHALDAAHLTFTAQRMQQYGLSMVAIHDSFGTHPCDVQLMHSCIRQAFVQLYTEHDPLQLLLTGIGQKDVSLPPRGTLDITQFLDSEFGFC